MKSNNIKIINKVKKFSYDGFWKYDIKFEEMKKLVNSKGGDLLSIRHSDRNKEIKIKCERMHIWWARWHSIKSGGWCSKCRGVNKKSIDDAKSLAIECGFICLSNEYKNGKTPLQWKCPKGHVWYRRLYELKKRRHCPKCLKK